MDALHELYHQRERREDEKADGEGNGYVQGPFEHTVEGRLQGFVFKREEGNLAGGNDFERLGDVFLPRVVNQDPYPFTQTGLDHGTHKDRARPGFE